MTNQKIKVEIWSDVVCPYCYIGVRKLEHALKATELTGYFEIEWHSYQLDPEFPAGLAEFTTSYLSRRKGISQDQIRQIYHHLTEQGELLGIDFQFEKALTFNTSNVHRIIQWSKINGKTTALEEAFFKAYFTDGVDLSKPEHLITVCESVGVSAMDVMEAFSNPQYNIRIEEDRYTAAQLGIRGVPYFLIDGRLPVAGAMPGEVFENALKEAVSQSR